MLDPFNNMRRYLTWTFILIVFMIVTGIAVAGEKIASTAGLSMSSMIDPQSGGQTLVLSTVLTLFLLRTP